MSGGNSASNYMTSKQAGHAAEYISAMNNVLNHNASAEEYKYQAAVLRNNKDIYESELKLNLSALQVDVDSSKKNVYLQTQKDINTLKSQVDINLNQIEALKGAQQERELAGALKLKNESIGYVQNVKEQLYSIRKDTTEKISKQYADFINRGLGSDNINARVMIYNNLDDREYRARLNTDYAMLAMNEGKSDYLKTTALQRQNLETDIKGVNLTIEGRQQDLNSTIALYRAKVEEITNKSNVQKQQMYYDTLVKTYQDEAQARLYSYKSNIEKTLGTQTLLSAQLRLASSSNPDGFVQVQDYY